MEYNKRQLIVGFSALGVFLLVPMAWLVTGFFWPGREAHYLGVAADLLISAFMVSGFLADVFRGIRCDKCEQLRSSPAPADGESR